MNKIELIGHLITKHKEVKFQKDGRDYSYTTIVLGLTDKKQIAINVWNDKSHQLDFFKIGELVIAEVNMYSEVNSKYGEGTYYHKINLKTIKKHDQAIEY